MTKLSVARSCGASKSLAKRRRKVPDGFRAQHPNIEWRSMAGMRDRLIHDYFGVDDVVRNRIPELRRELAAVLEA
jgi:uncharacterized protein with HEPN domain